MSYDILVYIVVLNAIATVWIFLGLRHMDFVKANRPARLHKGAAKLLWRSEPILPQHDPPKRPFSLTDANGVFFQDFKEFADGVNRFLADNYVASRFRL